MSIAAILVAGGSGSRFGAATPKQFLSVAGEPVIRHAARALLRHVAIVQPVGDSAAISETLTGLSCLPAVRGGAERQDSVLAGLEALARRDQPPEIALVHDAARPFFPEATIPNLIAALERADGAIPGLPIADTLKRVERGLIAATIPRQDLFRAQTPQAFRFTTLLALHRAAGPGATDDAALFERAGLAVAIVPGSEDNIKLTFPSDLARAERILGRPMQPRVGIGFDVHVLTEGRKLIICGVTVPHEKGLAGHSDADVGIHALCDAIYGALADGDIGRHFPPSEAIWKDADSSRFLVHASSRVAARGGVVSNVDVTLICERPKITPHAPAMITRLAGLLGIDAGRVSVKATTTERLGFTGRGEGIAAQAAVTILLPDS